MERKRISLLLILAVGFMDWVGIGLVYPMFSAMLFQPESQLLHCDTSHAIRGLCLGFLLSVAPITLFFSAPIFGAISDQQGRKRILTLGLALGMVGYLVAFLGVVQQNLAVLFCSRVLIGLSAGTGAVVEASLADLSESHEKIKNFGLFNMACGFGFTIGPFLGGKLSEWNLGWINGFEIPFFVAGIALLANFVAILWFFEETYQPAANTQFNLMAGIVNIKKAFESQGLRILFLVAFIACTGWSFYWEFIPVTWMSEYAFTTSDVGNMYAYGAAVYALSCGWLIRPIVDRFSARVVLLFSMILCAISTGIVAIQFNAYLLWILIPIQQYAIALFFPTSTALISNSVDDSIQGEVLGVLQSVQALAFAVSPLLAGPLLGLSLQAPIIVGCASMFIAAVVLAHYIRNSPEQTLAKERF